MRWLFLSVSILWSLWFGFVWAVYWFLKTVLYL